MRPLLLLKAALLVAALRAMPVELSQPNEPAEIGFSRIVRGWTNYSTAFNATHDTGSLGDFATVAGFYTPERDVRPAEYAAIVIWNGSGGQRLNFASFEFQVFIWSTLEAFTTQPRYGDIANWSFTMPTGGSTSVPDTTTRGGRPAYEVRFSVTNSSLVLTQGRSCLVGFAARTDAHNFGEIFVPTASHDGLSDVQAGDLVAGGWTYLINAGGSTIYSGQLATELLVFPFIEPPRAQIRRVGRVVEIKWPSSVEGFALESAADFSGAWWPIDDEPIEDDGFKRVVLPITGSRQWFRLRR